MIFQPQIVGKPLPALTNPGTAADLLSGKQLIDANGNVLTGTLEPVYFERISSVGSGNRWLYFYLERNITEVLNVSVVANKNTPDGDDYSEKVCLSYAWDFDSSLDGTEKGRMCSVYTDGGLLSGFMFFMQSDIFVTFVGENYVAVTANDGIWGTSLTYYARITYR